VVSSEPGMAACTHFSFRRLGSSLLCLSGACNRCMQQVQPGLRSPVTLPCGIFRSACAYIFKLRAPASRDGRPLSRTARSRVSICRLVSLASFRSLASRDGRPCSRTARSRASICRLVSLACAHSQFESLAGDSGQLGRIAKRFGRAAHGAPQVQKASPASLPSRNVNICSLGVRMVLAL